MGMPWNRASASYRETFLPRFLPYHHELAEQLGVKEGDRVLVPRCGPGTDAIAFARAVGEPGSVRAIDSDAAFGDIVTKRFKEAGVAKRATFEQAPYRDTSGAPYSIIATAFATFTEDEERNALEAWRDALAHHGKLGRMTWGPADDDDPYALYFDAIAEFAPALAARATDPVVERNALGKLFESAGLVMVRHTIIRHTQVFAGAEEFVDALVPALAWHPELVALGETTLQKIRARFLDRAGGPAAALSFQPAATIAIAALPGDEVELPHRPSVRAEAAKPS